MQIPNWVNRNPTKFKNRLLAECTYITYNFPRATINFEANGEMFVKGVIKTTLGGLYDFVMVYPESYPSQPQEVGILNDKVVNNGIPHSYGIRIKGGKKICIYAAAPPGNWNPISFTGLTTIQRAAMWCHAYEIWLLTKNWPIQSGD